MRVQQKEYLEILEISRKKYNSVVAIPCPAFDGELIYFNKYGFNHLIRKGRTVRTWNEQIARISLIPFAIEIVKRESRTRSYRTNIEKGVRAYFWTLKGSDGNRRIRVVIRRKNQGRLHFFSVMTE